MPAAKAFPISKGAPPAGMNFPNLLAAVADPAAASAADQDAPAAQVAAVIDDGFTPEQRRKNELEVDGSFKKYLMMKRMKMPLAVIRKKIRDDGGSFKPSDIDLFADSSEILEANQMLI